MSQFQRVLIPTHSDDRGSLSVMQDLLPFAVERIFWIYGADGMTRGGHRHRQCRQALVAMGGSVSVFMDDGNHTETVVLASPGECLLVEPEDWHSMMFGSHATLLVFASHCFDQDDYIDAPYGATCHGISGVET